MPDTIDIDQINAEFTQLLMQSIQNSAGLSTQKMPKVYTSYFAACGKLPKDIVPISISLKKPDWYDGKEYKALAPKPGFFQRWRVNHDNQAYIASFREQVLGKLDAKNVCEDLLRLSGGHPMALLCYERPGEFCHRHLVAQWLTANGCPVEEYMIKLGEK